MNKVEIGKRYLAIDAKGNESIMQTENILFDEKEQTFRVSDVEDSDITLPKGWIAKLVGYEINRLFLAEIKENNTIIEIDINTIEKV